MTDMLKADSTKALTAGVLAAIGHGTPCAWPP